MKLLKIKENINSKPRIAWLALIFIIVGSISFSNHPNFEYVALGLGFALGAYVEFFSGKNKKIK